MQTKTPLTFGEGPRVPDLSCPASPHCFSTFISAVTSSGQGPAGLQEEESLWLQTDGPCCHQGWAFPLDKGKRSASAAQSVKGGQQSKSPASLLPPLSQQRCASAAAPALPARQISSILCAQQGPGWVMFGARVPASRYPKPANTRLWVRSQEHVSLHRSHSLVQQR